MRMTAARISTTLAVIIALAGCTRATLITDGQWAPDVKEGLNDFMRTYGNRPEGGYAVFDFDNTTTIFDITENEMYYQILTMSFELDPDRMAEVLSTDLPMEEGLYRLYVKDIRSSYGKLYEKYGPFTYKGLDEDAMASVREDPQWAEFASKLCGFYSYIYYNSSPTAAYNWTKYWCCGMTEEQEYDLAVRSHTIFSATETKDGIWNGTVESSLGPLAYHYTLGFTVTPELKDLWRVLDANGIDVWVCSASGTIPVLAAIDMFGLRPYCTGVLSMTISKDQEGRFTNSYNYDGVAAIPCGGSTPDGLEGWAEGTLPTKAQTCGPGKVTAILNAIAPNYGGKGPLACFMDSTGDFNFCTEFADTKLVVCFNRGNRKVTDGGGLIAETAIYERDVLGYDLRKANAAGDILYLLQGRDDNGLRSLRPSNSTILNGSTEEKLFAGHENYDCYKYMCDSTLTVKEVIETFSHYFLPEYPGYRSISENHPI